jgi:signal transduction histidine kinase
MPALTRLNALTSVGSGTCFFTRFYTEVTSRTNTEASGLGLYLSMKLVEKMNAEAKGVYFVVRVYFPVI